MPINPNRLSNNHIEESLSEGADILYFSQQTDESSEDDDSRDGPCLLELDSDSDSEEEDEPYQPRLINRMMSGHS